MIKTLVSLSFSVMMLLACSVASSVVVTPTPTLTPPPAATLTPPPAATATPTPPPSDTPLPTPSPTDTPLPTPSPTDAPTPTTYPPVFDPAALGDNRALASFILTRKDKTTGGGEVNGRNETIGYIKEPFSAYDSTTTPRGHLNEYYSIGGRLYDKFFVDNSYVVFPEPDPTDLDNFLQRPADMRWAYLSGFGLISAQFASQEDFQGIPANHFKFDQTNLSAPTDPTGTYKIEKAQGDLYLAQDGNYLLRYHIKLTGNVYPDVTGYSPGEREFTEELSSINQLTEITLPAEYLALKLELDLGLPVPSGTRLHLINAGTSAGTYGVQYDYFMPVTVSPADFLEFYRNLAPTNGWTVSQVGGITNNVWCQGKDCVTLKKENAHVFLFKSTQCVSNMPANDTCFDAIYYR